MHIYGCGAGPDTSQKTSLTQIGTRKYVKIATGYSHTLVIDEGGHLWAWGNNTYGQIGNGTVSETYRVESPLQIPDSSFEIK